MTPAAQCRKNGWTVGMRLQGTDHETTTVMEITAIGRMEVLGVVISENGEPVDQYDETLWLFDARPWRKVAAAKRNGREN